jgi:hypothetical protein
MLALISLSELVVLEAVEYQFGVSCRVVGEFLFDVVTGETLNFRDSTK